MKQKGICMKRIAYITIACAFLSVSFAKAQQIRTLKDCLEEGLQNNYSLRIVHNEEQISKNNATLGNAGYLPTLDFSAGYTGNLDNIETKARATGEITKNTGVYDQTVNVGLNLNWTIFDGFNISTTYKQLKELERQGETNTRIAIEDFIAELHKAGIEIILVSSGAVASGRSEVHSCRTDMHRHRHHRASAAQQMAACQEK